MRREIKGLVRVRFPLSGQDTNEIKRRDKHVVARLPLFSDAGSTPAASTTRPSLHSKNGIRACSGDSRSAMSTATPNSPFHRLFGPCCSPVYAAA